jgi:hypothetical protein
MKLARIISGEGDYSDLHVFECRPCGVTGISESAGDFGKQEFRASLTAEHLREHRLKFLSEAFRQMR